MDLLKFHYHTLKLYGSVCALGNNRVAHALCSHVDESQLFYAIENTYLPGPMRSGFYDLLISMHLESAKRNRLGTNKEFIIPMTDETRSITLYTDKSCALPGVGLTTCLRPKLHFSSVGFVGTNPDIYTLSPVIPLQVSFHFLVVLLQGSPTRAPQQSPAGQLQTSTVYCVFSKTAKTETAHVHRTLKASCSRVTGSRSLSFIHPRRLS